MDLFTGVLPFLHVAEERSFRKAAARLGVTTAAVSKAVRRLEEDLGARLLERTSRQVALTPEGHEFLERAREAVAQVRAARETVAQAQRAPKGPLTVALPYILAQVMMPRLARLQARYPQLTLHVRLDDRYSRMVDEHIDVAIRVGALEDSSLVARRLLHTRWVTLASPAHLARHGTPARPSELSRHPCLKFVDPKGLARDWVFRREPGGPPEVMRLRHVMDVNHGPALLDLAAAGAGMCQVLDFMLDERARDGRLVEVLADHSAEGPPVHALCIPGRQSVPRVQALLQLLSEDLRPGGRASREPSSGR
ncbi:LysR family transcriptional regulator [Myxococcus sp. RHSTA-1-4]|uniref:LysR family transcriptional regulator n=1 Tax=Myxococcus sp. RHSTA-1-4 TaxID=2874601 RepID=UPI001CC14A19|nr:LysR family transcriptional regulator [Myxococcus sp. RHSTA-1-4]MBZ4417313.1 LysR family transcriptional regulator [Myxococcus sp. RHSTA-1-4]